jgi:micrococcal nuclease
MARAPRGSMEVRLVRWSSVLALWVLWGALLLFAGEAFQGKCVRVIGGDTVVVMRGIEEVEVRLEGIEAPDLEQAFGPEAKQGAEALMLSKPLIVEVQGTDRLGRMIGTVRVGPLDASLEMLKAGLAWYSPELPGGDALAAAEVQAHTSRRGLWSDPAPVPPWVWREQHPRDPHRALTDLASKVHIKRDADVPPGVSVPPVPPVQPSPPQAQPTPADLRHEFEIEF